MCLGLYLYINAIMDGGSMRLDAAALEQKNKHTNTNEIREIYIDLFITIRSKDSEIKFNRLFFDEKILRLYLNSIARRYDINLYRGTPN
jgi:hypothetical protein